MNIYDTTPIFINNMGTKWWLNEELQEYVESSGLVGYLCYYIETSNGDRNLVLINDEDIIVNNTLSKQDMIDYIDTLAEGIN